MEGDHRRDRVTREAEDQGRAGGFAGQDTEPGRPPGTEAHPPEALLNAKLRECALDVVVAADRDAASDDEDVHPPNCINLTICWVIKLMQFGREGLGDLVARALRRVGEVGEV